MLEPNQRASDFCGIMKLYYRRKLEEYENKPRGIASVEWHDCVHGEKTDPDYLSAIWLPVRRKR